MAQNGQLSARDLKPIGSGNLARGAAGAWNTMRLYIWQRWRIDIQPAGPRSSYRSLRWQWYFWNLWKAGKGNLAAYPGSSNHGWGLAVDVLTMAMANAIRRVGKLFGWSWDEGRRAGEWWHFRYVGGFDRPNPGPSLKFPVMRRGSGGPGQARSVRKIQKRLQAHGRRIKVDGRFGKGTHKKVRRFQRNNGLKADGIVGKKTWKKLNMSKRRLKRQRRRNA